MTTGERIKYARIKAGLSQTELADKIGVKFSAIHKYESGLVVNLKRSTIADLARALDVSPVWLMCMDDGEDEKPAEGEFSGLSEGEIEIVKMYRLLPDDRKTFIREMLKAAAALQAKDQKPNP